MMFWTRQTLEDKVRNGRIRVLMNVKRTKNIEIKTILVCICTQIERVTNTTEGLEMETKQVEGDPILKRN